ncbi:hypothetical protein SLS59_008217 [Nothophoma quercina]|uniref:Uncharacterized protein n=1 Tax=Nothophoma quercina TaxID=749835 RepID=A0ABR3QTU1_9PLEO
MTQPQDLTIERIRAYSKDAHEQCDDPMELDAHSTEARLAQTVRELQARVEEQQTALETLRAQSHVDIESAAYVSSDPHEKLRQLLAVKDAYKHLTPIAPFLPGQGSILPALLAARTLQQNVKGTKEAISSTQSKIFKTDAILRREEANLNDANLLTQTMEERIERLRAQQEDRSQKTPAQLARELIAAKRAQKDGHDAAAQTLGEAMNDFINDYLAAMIAAEELGGPVVGDMLDVEDNTLAAGFTKQGRAKSTKKAPSDKTRQRRIDQIWGNKAGIEEDEEPPTEAEAADAEMRQLIENLFATLIGPGGGKAYYQLQRDSAATRFLVRAKIARFHPKDATKLRLIDFGRELDD